MKKDPEEEISKLAETLECITNILLFVIAFTLIVSSNFLKKNGWIYSVIGMAVFVLFIISIKFVWPQKLKMGGDKILFQEKNKKIAGSLNSNPKNT